MIIFHPPHPLQSRDCLLHLSSSECLLKREVEEGRDALDKMAALNSAMALDKRELNKELLEVPLLTLPLSLFCVGDAAGLKSSSADHDWPMMCGCGWLVLFPDGARVVRRSITATGSEVGGQFSAEGDQNPHCGLQSAQVSVVQCKLFEPEYKITLDLKKNPEL